MQREPRPGARVARAGASMLLVLAIMFGGAIVLWVGVPLAWLWIGSQVQSETGSVGSAILVMLAGSVVSIVAIAALLARLNHYHARLQEQRGMPAYGGHGPLEAVMIVSALVAIVVFGIWFFLIEGPGPSLAPRN